MLWITNPPAKESIANSPDSLVIISFDFGDNVFDDLIKEIDVNGDGEISFKEFKEIMRKMLVKK